MADKKKYITTVRGDSQLRSDCRLIDNLYYLKDRDCVFYEKRWNRINNNKIIKYKNEWVSKSTVSLDNLVIIEILNNAFVFEYYRETLIFPEYSGHKFLNVELIKSLHPNFKPINTFNKMGYPYNIDLDFSLHKVIKENTRSIKEKYDFKDILKYTWGVELETWRINLQNCFLIENELYPVKDGSLKRDGKLQGHEYVTGIIKNNSDMNKFKNSCDLIDRNYNDNFSSLHVHVGVDLDVHQTTTLYMLILKLQNQINQFLPNYRKSLDYLRKKEKDYCKNIEGLNLFSSDNPERDLMSYYFDGPSTEKDFKTKIHHLHGSGKWNFSKRYTNVNFLNYILGGPTIEFRCHDMTTNINDIYAWMKIIRDIIDFSLSNEGIIRDKYRKILLEDVIVDKDVREYYVSKTYHNSPISGDIIKKIEINEIN